MRWVLAIFALPTLCGCAGTSDNSALSETTGPRIGKPQSIKFGPKANLGLLNGSRRLHVGDPWKEGLSFYAKPENAADIRDVPPGWETLYRGRGWQTNNESFGILIYEDYVALAIRIYEHADEDFFNETLARYQARFPDLKPISETAKVARYLFAQENKDRLMICATRAYAGDLTITIAVGHADVMDGLHMSPDAAKVDAERAENSFKVIG